MDHGALRLCISSLVCILLLGLNSAFASGEYRLNANEIGPITFSSVRVRVRNAKQELTAFPQQVAELTATGRNDSEVIISNAKFCVQTGRRTSGCDFKLLINEPWFPGEELTWLIDKRARPGIDGPARIMILKLKTRDKPDSR